MIFHSGQGYFNLALLYLTNKLSDLHDKINYYKFPMLQNLRGSLFARV